MQPNFIQPWNSGNFMYQYMQQHAAMTNFIDRMHYGINYGNGNSGNSCNEMNYGSCCASCCCCNCSCRRRHCSCCSSGSCPKASPSKPHQAAACSKASSSSKAEEYYSEIYEEEQFQDKEMDEDEMSDCEYEFNVDAILAMRAAKKELLKQEKLESKKNKSKSKNKESSESKSENESRSDSSTSTESEKEEIEYIDITKAEMVDKRPHRIPVLGGGFNRTEEEQARNYILEQIFGREGKEKIMGLELSMLLKFEDLYDEEQPSFWPVLPLRM